MKRGEEAGNTKTGGVDSDDTTVPASGPVVAVSVEEGIGNDGVVAPEATKEKEVDRGKTNGVTCCVSFLPPDDFPFAALLSCGRLKTKL